MLVSQSAPSRKSAQWRRPVLTCSDAPCGDHRAACLYAARFCTACRAARVASSSRARASLLPVQVSSGGWAPLQLARAASMGRGVKVPWAHHGFRSSTDGPS
eukprot:3680288-Alexandrium_andersonii.AAC.1